MQAIEAWNEGISLSEKAKKAKELGEALEKWGYYKPK
jgi:ribulose-bisphosphate carboxylase large chain